MSPHHLPVSPRTWRALLWSMALAALGYLLFSLWGGWQAVVAAMQRVHGSGLALLLGLSLVNYVLRFVRWQAYLQQMGHPVPWGASARIYLAGFALTTTPGKLGEAVRSVFLKGLGVPYAHSMVAFMSERLADLVAIVLITCVGVLAFPSFQPLIALGGLLIGVLLVMALRGERVLGWLAQRFSSAKLHGLLGHAGQMVLSARSCHRAGLLAWIWPLSLVSWMAEAWGLHLLLGWLGVPCDWTFSFFVYAAGMLAGALSFLPGGLGGTEAVMVGLLLWQGATQPVAVAATVIVRLATLWFAVLLGLLALAWLWRRPDEGAAPSQPAPQPEPLA